MADKEVTITKVDGKIVLSSRYHPELPNLAKMAGGKWDPAKKVWVFDERDEDRVRAICEQVYGTDGNATETVTVRVNMAKIKTNVREVWALGRLIAYRPGRDWPVRLGDGVVLVSGGFEKRGGSARYPEIGNTDAVLEVRDVPVAIAKRFASSEAYTILE